MTNLTFVVRIVRRFLTVVSAAIFYQVAWHPAHADVPFFPDIQKIVDRGTIVVAVIDQDYPPFIQIDEGGSLGGFDIELARLIAADLKVEAEFLRSATTFDDVADQVARSEADIAVSFLSISPQRSKSVHFTNTYVKQNFTVLFNRQKSLQFRQTCPKVADLVELAEKDGQLGVVADTAHEENLRSYVTHAEPAVFADSDEMIAALRKGEIRASLQGELVARRLMRDNPAYRIQLRLCEIGRTEDHIGIAVRPDAPHLVPYINALLLENGVSYDIEQLVYHEGPWSFGPD